MVSCTKAFFPFKPVLVASHLGGSIQAEERHGPGLHSSQRKAVWGLFKLCLFVARLFQPGYGHVIVRPFLTELADIHKSTLHQIRQFCIS